jgi:hypothetical protein
MTMLTVKPTAASTASSVAPSRFKLWGLGGGGAVLAVSFMFGLPSRRRWISMLALLCMIAVAGAIDCGGNGGQSTNSPSSPATTAGNYVFAVAGTDRADPKITVSASVGINVQ